MNYKFFQHCKSSADLEKMKVEIYQMFRLDLMAKDHHLRKDVDEEYEYLKKAFLNREKAKDEDSVNELSLDEILQEVLNLKLSSEVCGKWLWLTDQNAFKHKDYLRSLGFRYAKNKKSWYWRPVSERSANQDPMPMSYIRKKYGTQTIPVE
jgi:hypothetical protein